MVSRIYNKVTEDSSEYCRLLLKAKRKIASTTHQGALVYCKIKIKLSAAAEACSRKLKSSGQGIENPVTARRIKVNKKWKVT